MGAIRTGAMAVALTGALGIGGARALAAELSDADRQTIAQLLGEGVLGDAVSAAPLAENLAGLQDGTWAYQIVSGKNQGATEAHVAKRLQRDASGYSWRYQAGPKTILFLRAAEDGSLALVSEQDIAEGVVVTYAPGEPVVIPNLQPGESKQLTVDVKVYDLSNPSELKHTGELEVTYSYLGAYRVTVPAGSYDAALIKWTFQGKIGPASVEDTQYRFAAAGPGMVASIDKKDISAFLLYHDDSKTGKVLQQSP